MFGPTGLNDFVNECTRVTYFHSRVMPANFWGVANSYPYNETINFLYYGDSYIQIWKDPSSKLIVIYDQLIKQYILLIDKLGNFLICDHQAIQVLTMRLNDIHRNGSGNNGAAT